MNYSSDENDYDESESDEEEDVESDIDSISILSESTDSEYVQSDDEPTNKKIKLVNDSSSSHTDSTN